MTTVVSRKFRSSPHRDASSTWVAIVELLTKGKDSAACRELTAAGGVASSLIADQLPKDCPIVITCDGPRTRIYCTYDDDAIDGSDANEDTLGFDPLKGDWHVSLPCQKDELEWVTRALAKVSNRITARDQNSGLSADNVGAASATQVLSLNVEGFLKS